MDGEVCAAFQMISRWKCVLVSTARRENTPPWAGRSGMPHVRPLEVASPTKPALGGHTRRHGRGVVVECARTFRRTRRGTAQAAAGRTPARNRAVWPAARSAFCSTQATRAHSAVLHGGSLSVYRGLVSVLVQVAFLEPVAAGLCNRDKDEVCGSQGSQGPVSGLIREHAPKSP